MCYAFRFDPALFRRNRSTRGFGRRGRALALALLAALATGLAGAAGLQTAAADSATGFPKPTTGRYSGLPLPRFVSIKSSKANMRIGPGEEYPVKWVYQRRNLPVEIIGEYDLWRQVRDKDGEEGWIHSALLDGRRYGLIQGDGVVFTRKPGKDNREIVAKVEAGVVVRLLSCSPGWCRVEAKGVKGWVPRAHIWGLKDGEIFD